jgi:hypothetical protein
MLDPFAAAHNGEASLSRHSPEDHLQGLILFRCSPMRSSSHTTLSGFLICNLVPLTIR